MTFVIELRTGVQFDADGFVTDEGTSAGEIARIDAPYPGAARAPAEAALRAAGITWDSYAPLMGCAWNTPRGIVAMVTA